MKLLNNEITYKENNTMALIGRNDCITADSVEGKAIMDILNAFGVDDNVIATPSDLIWLCSHVMSIGKIYGIRQERNRRLKSNGKG